jgi:hypothetical protein
LPPLSEVHEASLTLEVELAPPFPVRLLLYEVLQDWSPGAGGTLRNNVSPPARGEVWWNERAHEVAPWGLPGAGFASDTEPAADTGASFLAETICAPGRPTLVLASEALADYATRRLRSGSPLLFLIKLADFQEDLPNSLLTLYSGNQGDSRNTARRPQLTLTWRSGSEVASASYDLRLEHGRERPVAWPAREDATWRAWSFEPDPGSDRPALEVRGGPLVGGAGWVPSPPVSHEPPEGLEARVRAVRDPVTLGQAFESRIHDTWIRSAPPEEQVVPCRFVSPSGAEHRVLAEFAGDHSWTIRFEPDELGPWRYVWRHDFVEEATFESASGGFDVVIGDRENARAQLERFLAALGAAGQLDEAAKLRQMVVFSRLERAVMQLETPESFRSPAGAELKGLLNRIRALLAGEPVPDPIPLLPDDPPPWARQR